MDKFLNRIAYLKIVRRDDCNMGGAQTGFDQTPDMLGHE